MLAQMIFRHYDDDAALDDAAGPRLPSRYLTSLP